MRGAPVKLGPLALLLCVITICLAVMALLSITTARADNRLAERYAETVRTRYELEREGQAFLRELDGEINNGGLPAADSAAEDGAVERVFELDGTTLTVRVDTTRPDSRGRAFTVTQWRIEKSWSENESLGRLWGGK